jgi:hypothetical protein
MSDEAKRRRSATKRHKTHKRFLASSVLFCGYFPLPNGDDRVRTDGLRSASAALSQLSYIPLPNPESLNMGLGRVELPTSRLSGVRSNHLSYRPDGVLFGISEANNFEAENVQKKRTQISERVSTNFKQYS